MSARGICEPGPAAGTAQAVILYDRLESMLAANALLGRLPPPPDGAREWAVNSWQFAMLRWNREGQPALRDTAAAEVMILAIRNAKEVEDWPEGWLARWAAGRRGAARLALVPVGTAGSTEPAPGLIASLRQLAEWACLPLRVLDQSGADLCPPAAPCVPDGRLRLFSRGPAEPPREAGEQSPQRFAEAAKLRPQCGSALDPLWAVNF